MKDVVGCFCFKRICSHFVKEIDGLLSKEIGGNQSKLDSTVKEPLSNIVDGREDEDL